MFWIALHLPLLTLEAFRATLADPSPQRPLVLVENDHRIGAVDAAAAACGIRPGMKRATALALAGDLLVAGTDAARDAAALQAVAHAALAFTPAVALHDARTVVLELQSCLRLFGGPARLYRRLSKVLAPLGHRVQAAAAPTAMGAALLARWHPRREATVDVSLPWLLGDHATDLGALHAVLDAAPVWLLGPGREHWEALQGMGLHTLSDLRVLPRSGVARRFGAAVLDELDRAYGVRPDPRDWIELPPGFESRLELYARADTAEQVLQGAAVLLARLVAWAGAHQALVGSYTLRMLHEPHRGSAVPATELRVELAAPALDAAHLQLLLRERLARIDLAAPTLELQLHCSHVVAGGAANGELFPTRATTAEGLTRLLERLRARLGDDQVQRLEAVPDHRPECASRAVPVGAASAAAGATPPPPAAVGLPLHRPAWLLPDPLPLAENRDALPLLEGRPLQLLSGPERIEAGWWDGGTVARDYYIAQAADAALVWVYRSRLPDAAGGRGRGWFLHGRYA